MLCKAASGVEQKDQFLSVSPQGASRLVCCRLQDGRAGDVKDDADETGASSMLSEASRQQTRCIPVDVRRDTDADLRLLCHAGVDLTPRDDAGQPQPRRVHRSRRRRR